MTSTSTRDCVKKLLSSPANHCATRLLGEFKVITWSQSGGRKGWKHIEMRFIFKNTFASFMSTWWGLYYTLLSSLLLCFSLLSFRLLYSPLLPFHCVCVEKKVCKSWKKTQLYSTVLCSALTYSVLGSLLLSFWVWKKPSLYLSEVLSASEEQSVSHLTTILEKNNFPPLQLDSDRLSKKALFTLFLSSLLRLDLRFSRAATCFSLLAREKNSFFQLFNV